MKKLVYKIYKVDDSGESTIYKSGTKREIEKAWKKLLLNLKPGCNYQHTCSWEVDGKSIGATLILSTPIYCNPNIDVNLDEFDGFNFDESFIPPYFIQRRKIKEIEAIALTENVAIESYQFKQDGLSLVDSLHTDNSIFEGFGVMANSDDEILDYRVITADEYNATINANSSVYEEDRTMIVTIKPIKN